MGILRKLELFTIADSTVTGDIADNKGIPKKDGSGKGLKLNKNRGGCKEEEEEEENEND